MMMKTIGITGGTGFVGRHLSRALAAAGHKVTVFSRGRKAEGDGVRYAHWDPDKREIDTAALADLDAVVNLAGAGVADKRWSRDRKLEIVDSRVAATAFLIGQLRAHAPACRTFIAASATGYYGPDRGGPAFTEDAPPFDDFLADVCVQWEGASMKAAATYRTVIFRLGIVLGGDGGAYPQLAGPMKFGIMPVLGSGRQVVSWVHVDDVAGMMKAAVEGDSYTGVYNAVAPHPVTHFALMKAIAGAKGGIRIPAPVPPFVLRLIMGESSIEVLKSTTVSSAKVEGAGYEFRYPDIETAVRDITP